MGFMDAIIHPPETEKEIFNQLLAESTPKTYQNGIPISDFLHLVSQGHFKNISVHEFLEKCDLEFCTPPPEPRNPELEKKISQLKAEQANAEYKSMVKNLGPPSHNDKISFRDDIKSVNSQITAVINFVFAVTGSFFFSYKAVEYALPEPNIPAQVMMGLITGAVVALADLYFLLRTTI